MTTGVDELIVPLVADLDGEPVYCVHPVSGSAYGYAAFANDLDVGRPILGIEAPGFDTALPPLTSVLEFAETYAAALTPGRDHQLIGWSMGGVIAFEMALKLAAAGERVGLLVLIDTPVPQVCPPPTERETLELFFGNLAGAAGLDDAVAGLGNVPRTVTTPDGYFAELATTGILGQDAEVLRGQYDVFRAHVLALSAHAPTGVFTGELIHLRAADSDAADMDWTEYAHTVDAHVITGSHYSIWAPENVGQITSIVRSRLGGRP